MHEAIDALEEALEGELPLVEEGTVAGSLARAYTAVGDLRYAAELAEARVANLERQGLDLSVTSDLYSALIDVYLERGDLVRAEVIARRTLTGADSLAAPEARAVAHWQASRVLAQLERWDDALDMAARSRALSEQTYDRARAGHFHYTYARLCLEAEPPRLEEARQHLRAAETRLTEDSSPSDRASILAERGRLELLGGNLEKAIALADQAASTASPDGLEAGRGLFLKGLAQAALDRREGARAALQEAAQIFAKHGDRKQQAACWREIGEIDLVSGDPDAAAKAFRAGLEALDSSRSRA
jgi:tetratricopeptide (TPR) repeat protein